MPEDGACRWCGRPARGDPGTDRLCFACLLAQGLPEGRSQTPWRPGSLTAFLHILNVVADGPNGRVYLARWTLPDGGYVALKRGHAGSQLDPERKAEILRLLELDHPHVATLFDVGQDAEGRPYTVMEYVPGVPLPAYWCRPDLLATERLELLRQTADTLVYLHGHGLTHSNLKPTNVLVLGPPVGIKLLDLEAVVPSPDATGRQRAPLDPDADIRALGSMLRSMLDDIRDASTADAELRRIVERAVAASPAERYPTMQEMAADLVLRLATVS